MSRPAALPAPAATTSPALLARPRALLAAFAAGALFALGLVVSGMTVPARVIGFLDVGGAWDFRLALVLGTAVPIYALALRLARRRARPAFGADFPAPAVRPVDARLLGGAALFGLGWGLAGYCPGPALVSLGGGSLGAVTFVLAMLAGMLLVHLVDTRRLGVMLRRNP